MENSCRIALLPSLRFSTSQAQNRLAGYHFFLSLCNSSNTFDCCTMQFFKESSTILYTASNFSSLTSGGGAANMSPVPFKSHSLLVLNLEQISSIMRSVGSLSPCSTLAYRL